jgi:hypothetical protein
LTLVRGGRDSGGDDPGADWQAFCQRIGWHEPEGALAADYERVLAARIFAGGDDDDDDVVPISVERARLHDAHGAAQRDTRSGRELLAAAVLEAPTAEAGAEAPGGAAGWTEWPVRQARPHRGRGALWACAALAVAAVLGVAAAAVFSWGAPPTATTVPRRTPDAQMRDTRDSDGPTPTELSPTDPERQPEDVPRDAHAAPAPQPNALPVPDPDGRNPGARVAQRARRAHVGAPRPAHVADEPTRPAVYAPSDSPFGYEPVAHSASGRELALRPAASLGAEPSPATDADILATPVERVALGAAHASPPSLSPSSHATGAAGTSDIVAAPALVAREDAGAALAPWSIADASERWLDVGLTAPREPAGTPPAVRVMAQLDLGRALNRL